MAHINGRYEAVERVNTELDEGAPTSCPLTRASRIFPIRWWTARSTTTKLGHGIGESERRREGNGSRGWWELRGLVNELILTSWRTTQTQRFRPNKLS